MVAKVDNSKEMLFSAIVNLYPDGYTLAKRTAYVMPTGMKKGIPLCISNDEDELLKVQKSMDRIEPLEILAGSNVQKWLKLSER